MPKQWGTPGPRAIHPSAATSSSLAACDPMAQLLFDRLIAAADDQGRLLGDVTLVRAACMPLIASATPRRIGAWLDSLAEQGMLVRYEASGLSLIQLRNWWDYQSQRHAWPSRWSPPAGWIHDQTRGHGADGGGPAGRPRGADGGPGGGLGPPSARTRHAGPGLAGPMPAADGPAARDQDPETRRAVLNESIAFAHQAADNPSTPEVVRRAAQRAIETGEAELRRMGANGVGKPPEAAEEPEVDFDAPSPPEATARPRSPRS